MNVEHWQRAVKHGKSQTSGFMASQMWILRPQRPDAAKWELGKVVELQLWTLQGGAAASEHL